MERIEFRAPLKARWRVADEPAFYGVGRPRVYVDTSIPSYFTNRVSGQRDTARRQRITNVWWRRYRDRFSLYTSDEVTQEARKGDPVLAERRVKLLKGITSLDSSRSSDEIAFVLIESRVLPPNAKVDAKHIAIAAVHSLDYLLTWNCKHLANSFIAQRVVQTCEMLGFRSPKICTPEVLMRACRHERPHP